MPSLVSSLKTKLEEQGECVVLANLESGWFAINPNTWKRRIERCKGLGRIGPNLIVYRTRSGEERDHHVVPYEVIASMLSADSLKLQKNGTYRWNLTLANDRLHVSHRKGYESAERFLASRLIVEESVPDGDSGIASERVSLRTKSYEGIVEGIARESIVLSRSRSAALLREALKALAARVETIILRICRVLSVVEIKYRWSSGPGRTFHGPLQVGRWEEGG